MSREIIAIDIDDVLADTTESVRIQVNKITGARLLPEHYLIPGSYSRYYERVWETNGLHQVSFDVLSTEMTENQSYVNVIKGAQAALEHLSNRFDFILITSRDFSWERATDEWVHKKLGSICGQIIFSSDPRHDSSKSKGELCHELNANWLIDDRVEYCQSAIDSGVNAILFGNYGWQYQEVPAGIQRCKDWSEIMDYFDAKS